MLFANGKSTPGCAAAAGTIVARCGGNSRASAHWSNPAYEPPHIATLPFDQGCFASHSTTSCAVAALVGERLEHAAGVAAATHVDQGEHVAVSREVDRAIVVAVADVGREREDDRQRASGRDGR